MTYTKTDLGNMKKDELVDLALELQSGQGEVEREVWVKSPAGPMHKWHGFVDDTTGALVITGLPEDELGHWSPYYVLAVNEQPLKDLVIDNGG